MQYCVKANLCYLSFSIKNENLYMLDLTLPMYVVKSPKDIVRCLESEENPVIISKLLMSLDPKKIDFTDIPGYEKEYQGIKYLYFSNRIDKLIILSENHDTNTLRHYSKFGCYKKDIEKLPLVAMRKGCAAALRFLIPRMDQIHLMQLADVEWNIETFTLEMLGIFNQLVKLGVNFNNYNLYCLLTMDILSKNCDIEYIKDKIRNDADPERFMEQILWAFEIGIKSGDSRFPPKEPILAFIAENLEDTTNFRIGPIILKLLIDGNTISQKKLIKQIIIYDNLDALKHFISIYGMPQDFMKHFIKYYGTTDILNYLIDQKYKFTKEDLKAMMYGGGDAADHSDVFDILIDRGVLKLE